MLQAGLDLSRRRLDVCLLDEGGELIGETAVAPDVDGLRGLGGRLAGRRVRAVIESMNGARLVHDTLEEHGWEVLVADAQKVKGLAPLACKTDKIDARVLALLSQRDLVPAIWLPDPTIRRERELARFRLQLVRHRSTLKNRVHATPITFGHPCPVSDLFGLAGRELLDRLAIPDPWRRNVDASLELIDELELQIAELTVELKRQGADHHYIPLLVTAPGFGWINAFTVASEIGDIEALRLPGQAVRLHRPVPTRHPVRRHRPPRPDLQARPALSALGPVRGRAERLQTPALRRTLPAHQAPPRAPTRPQGRPDRTVTQADRGDLAHAHPQPTPRSGKRRFSSSRLTAHLGIAPPERASHFA
jgi:transposase